MQAGQAILQRADAMKAFLAAAAVAFSIAALPQAARADASPVSSAPTRVEGGLIEGVSADGVTLYRAIPYAAAPTGARRWRPPQPVGNWTGVRRARSFAPACAQNGASIVRVHDVAATADALAVWRAVAAQAVPAGKPAKPAMPKWGDDD